MEDKEQLTFILSVLKQIPHSETNQWFWDEVLEVRKIVKKHNINNPSNIGDLTIIKKNTSKIIDYLSLSPELSIDYSFIGHPLLRKRLELDNLRMENVRFDLKEKDEMVRLYNYIVNAFYQIENLINFYYHEKYKNIDSILTHLESIEGNQFKRKKEKSVGDITIATKIYAFNKTFYQNDNIDFTGYNIDSLRQIRNEGSHRASRIKSIENENKRLHDFLKHTTFDSILTLVKDLAEKIKVNI
jgi:hypothetical protein